jgi:6-phosphofructokinase 1
LSFSGDEREEFIVPLNEDIVRTWDRYGGTNLGTSRYNRYNPKITTAVRVFSNINILGLGALVAIGGDDTLSVAAKLSRDGVNVVGIPKTIDRDLVGTDYSLGFETAVEVITDIVDKLRTTAGSHRRIFVVETMGRSAGWLALKGGESCGAYIILIPEHDFSIDRVNELIMQARKGGTRYDIILVAEGAKPAGGKTVCKDESIDSFGHESLGGIGEYLSKEINSCLGLESGAWCWDISRGAERPALMTGGWGGISASRRWTWWCGRILADGQLPGRALYISPYRGCDRQA